MSNFQQRLLFAHSSNHRCNSGTQIIYNIHVLIDEKLEEI